MAKELQQKVRNFLGLIPMFVEVTDKKLIGGTFLGPLIGGGRRGGGGVKFLLLLSFF